MKSFKPETFGVNLASETPKTRSMLSINSSSERIVKGHKESPSSKLHVRERSFRIKFLPREKASYIMLRRLGYSLQELSETFGRSTSVLHRILKRAGFRLTDLRKLPARVRKLAHARRTRTMMFLARAWEAFMLGEGEKPP